VSESKSDRGTKIYIGVLACIALAILVAWLPSMDTRAWEINHRLEEDSEISAYPFPFRVLETSKGVALVATPRSVDVPAIRFLNLVDPSLRNAGPNSVAAIAAQKRLGEIQGRVRKLIEAEPDIQSVSWRLDADGLAQHGVRLDQ
jgi:hypothetical protein